MHFKNTKVRGMDWLSLRTELVGSIAGCLNTFEDFMAFRGVCTLWRSEATTDMFVPVSKVPLLMLTEKDDSDEREFYSLSKRKIITRIPLPGAKGKGCMDVGFGWILTLASSGEVCLLKPFSPSARLIELPSYTTFPIYEEYQTDPECYFIARALLTANPSETLNFALFVAVNQHMGFWRNGDEKWTVIDIPYEHMMCHNGKVYIMDRNGYIQIWDPRGTDLSKPQVQIKAAYAPTHKTDSEDHYLVKSTDGALLIITRNNTNIGADHFSVMIRVKGICVETNELGGDAIFLGDNAAVCVDATEFSGVLKSNCIYFTEIVLHLTTLMMSVLMLVARTWGFIVLEIKSVERFDVESFSPLSAAVGISVILKSVTLRNKMY